MIPALSVVVHPSTIAGEWIQGNIYSYDSQTGDFTLFSITDYHELQQWEIQSGEPIQIPTLDFPYLPPGAYLVTVASDMTAPYNVVIGTSGSSPDSTSFKRTYNEWNFQSIYETPMVRLVVRPEGLEENKNEPKKMMKVVDILGREIEDEPNTVLIYVYSDGTTEKVFRFE